MSKNALDVVGELSAITREYMSQVAQLKADRAELIETLRDLLRWGIDSDSVKGVLSMAAIHGMGATEETPQISAAIERARALLARLEGK